MSTHTSSHSADTLLSVPQGSFRVKRLPYRAKELLRAWDAADEYLLEQFADAPVLPNARVLIINDSFGALATALHRYQPTALSDSYLSHQATRLNLTANNVPLTSVHIVDSLARLDGVFDWVLIKVPKTLALLEDELIRLRSQIHADTQILVAAMVKALPPSLWTLIERLLGKTDTALTKKKAKLIFVKPNLELATCISPYPIYYTLEQSNYLIANHANVFSRDRLDIGTRFFLQHLPINTAARDIIDLGCGNGVLGLGAAAQNPLATLHFIDESYMAVASARENFQRAFSNTRSAQFYISDGLTEFSTACADLILCNPPFHQQHTVGDYLALTFFKQARRVLRTGGQLWIIGNRHLGYHVALKRLFGNYQLIASNSKFIILQAIISRVN